MKTITYNPETHVIVPREPSEQMLCKAIKVDLGKDCDEKGICINLYQAMLAVAPQPESVESEPVAMLPFAILDDELADLRRFTDCADDGEGYDVPKNRMKRLAEIGLLRHVSAGYYEHTVFGLSVLNGDFTTPQPDRTAELEKQLATQKEYYEFKAENDSLNRDAERYRMLRRGQRWSVVNGIGDYIRADELDAAIDATMTQGDKP